jgi:hypothetical protein
LRFCDFRNYSIFEDLAIFHVLAIVGFAWVVKEVPFQSEKKSKKKSKKCSEDLLQPFSSWLQKTT